MPWDEATIDDDLKRLHTQTLEATSLLKTSKVQLSCFHISADQRIHPFSATRIQHDDYVTLKERVCAAVNANTSPPGVASLEIAVETLKVGMG